MQPHQAVHILLVPGEYDHHLSCMRRLGKELDHLVNRLGGVLAVYQTPGFVDEQDLADGLVKYLPGLGARLADVLA